jgi:hypothetical protein
LLVETDRVVLHRGQAAGQDRVVIRRGREFQRVRIRHHLRSGRTKPGHEGESGEGEHEDSLPSTVKKWAHDHSVNRVDDRREARRAAASAVLGLLAARFAPRSAQGATTTSAGNWRGASAPLDDLAITVLRSEATVLTRAEEQPPAGRTVDWMTASRTRHLTQLPGHTSFERLAARSKR